MSTAALVTLAKRWKQPTWPPADEWGNRCGTTVQRDYYSVVKRNEVQLTLGQHRSPLGALTPPTHIENPRITFDSPKTYLLLASCQLVRLCRNRNSSLMRILGVIWIMDCICPIKESREKKMLLRKS